MSKPRRILLVNDYMNDWLADRYDLEAAGYDITLAQDYDEAARALKQGKFDLVVSDFKVGPFYADDLIEPVRDHNKRERTKTGMLVHTSAQDIDAPDYFVSPKRRDIRGTPQPDDERMVKKHSLRLKSAPFPLEVSTFGFFRPSIAQRVAKFFTKQEREGPQ